MDIEKTHSSSLQLTTDTPPIIYDTFLFQGQLTDLYLFTGYMVYSNADGHVNIEIDDQLMFEIVEQADKSVGIRIFDRKHKRELAFIRQFWNRCQEWETLLIQQLRRHNFHQFFKPIKKIGKGNFATVYLATDLKNNRNVAVKAFMKQKIYKDQHGKASLENEIRILRNLNNENISKLYGVYQTSNSVYMVMEYAEGVNLETYLKHHKDTGREISRELRIIIMKRLLEGLREMASKNVVHRDLKPENIMISKEGKVKIVDFGLATDVSEPSYIFIRCGTPGFVAPEIINIKDLNTARMHTISDVFSLGAVFYQLLFGKSLFNGQEHQEVMNLNRICKIHIPQGGITVQEKFLLQMMLEKEHLKRITAKQCLQMSVFINEVKKQCSCLCSCGKENQKMMIIQR